MLDLVVTPLRFDKRRGPQRGQSSATTYHVYPQDGTYGHAAPFVRCCDLRASSNQEQEKCFSVNTRDGPGCSRQHMVLEPL